MLREPYPRRIILLRHVQTLAQALTQHSGGTSRAIGHHHVPLSEHGIRCAHNFGLQIQKYMNQGQAISLYSSPSQRALESFGPIYQKTPEKITMLPDCQEIFLGDWEGISFANIKAQWPDLYEKRGSNMATFRPPFGTRYGENFQDVQKRMLKAITKLALEEGTEKQQPPALLISHSGAIRTILCHCENIPLENIMHYKIDNLHGLVLDCHADGAVHLMAKGISGMEIEKYF